MKNTELFRIIEALVEANASSRKPEKPSFAQRYCQQRLQRMKLVPFNPNLKMNKIMKNFNQLDSYVNIEQLFECINLIQEKREQQAAKTNKTTVCKSHKAIVDSFDAEKVVKKVKQRVKEELGSFYKRRHMKENEQVWDFIEELEHKSHSATYLLNSSPKMEYNVLFNKKDSDDTNQWQDQRSPWDYNQKFSSSIFQPQKETVGLTLKDPQQDTKRDKERAELMHQISTYLQIVLQNKHKLKWSKFNKNNSSWEIIRTVEEPAKNTGFTRATDITKSIRTTRVPAVAGAVGMVATPRVRRKGCMTACNGRPQEKLRPKKLRILPLTAYRNHQLSLKKTNKSKQMQDSFTFRNRTIKKCLMKKMQDFVEFVEGEQKKLKKDKNSSASQINRLEDSYESNYNQISNWIMAGDDEIKAVQNKVRDQK